jgi:hypothetical protein
MRKRLIFSVIIFFNISTVLLAQTNKKYVVNTGAGSVDKGNFNVTYYIGDFIGYDTPTELLLSTRMGEITLFPNPVKTILKVKSSVADLDKIQIFNVSGIKVYETTLLNNEVNFSNFPDGIYLIKILDNHHEDLGSVKIIKN